MTLSNQTWRCICNCIRISFLSHCISYGFSEVAKLDLKKKSASKKVEEEEDDDDEEDEDEDEDEEEVEEETHKKTPATARYNGSKNIHKSLMVYIVQ